MSPRIRFQLDIDFECCKDRLRLVPHFGPVEEQHTQVAPTPQFYNDHKEHYLMAAFNLSDSQQSVFLVSAIDKRGNKAILPVGTVTWAVDQVSLLALTPSADGLSCKVAAVGPLGTATVSVKVSDTAGTTLAAGSIEVTVTGGAATTIVINPETPTEQP